VAADPEAPGCAIVLCVDEKPSIQALEQSRRLIGRSQFTPAIEPMDNRHFHTGNFRPILSGHTPDGGQYVDNEKGFDHSDDLGRTGVPRAHQRCGAVENGTVFVLEPNGKMMQAKFKEGGMQAFMAKKPRQVSRRMLVVMMDGKFYMLPDPKGSASSQWLEMRDAISH
jgi:hypothetical protein